MEYITALRDSLKKKLRILEEISNLSKLQSELLTAEELDYEAFDKLVDDKDVCIEKIEELDEGFELVYKRVEEELKDHKGQYKDLISQMQELISKITEQSTSIQALEERNRQAVTNAINRDRRAISEGKRSVNVAMNYYRNMNGFNVPNSQYLDKKN